MSNPSQNITSLFTTAAHTYPQSIALQQDNHALTFRQLLDEVTATAAYYSGKGLESGNRALVVIPMSLDLYRVVLALMYIGVTPVFLDEWVTGDRLKECLYSVPCNALIGSGKLILYATFNGPLRSIPLKIKSSKKESGPSSLPMYEASADETALITFTTGSTGTPKAADRTHAFLNAQFKALKPLLPEAHDRSLTTLPIVVLLQLALGKTTILPPEKFKIDKPETIVAIADVCKEQKVNTVIVSPFVMDRLTIYTLPQLRHIITGGGPVFPLLAGDITIKFPQADAHIIYGSTEAEPISHITTAEVGNVSINGLKRNGLPVGIPVSETTVAIIPFNTPQLSPQTITDWQALHQSAGIAGEIVVTGNHVLKHYINNPEAESFNKVKVDGKIWHRTGDAGRQTDDGMLYFLGRSAEYIEWNGRQIFPAIATNCFKMRTRAFEAALLLHKGYLTLVIEAYDKMQEKLLANGLEDAEIEDATIVYVKKIPKDPRHNTKIDYEKLASML